MGDGCMFQPFIFQVVYIEFQGRGTERVEVPLHWNHSAFWTRSYPNLPAVDSREGRIPGFNENRGTT